MAELLGIQAYTGEPKGDSTVIISELNKVGLTGRFARMFENIQELNGQVDREFILGTPQASKNDWYIIDDAMKNARSNPINFQLYSYKPTDAVQATLTVKDRLDSVDSIKLYAAYRGNNSYGIWDNDTCVQFKTSTRQNFKLTQATLANATTYYLNGIVGIYPGEIIKISTYYMKVLTVDESLYKITVQLDGTTPVFNIGDTVEIIQFKIITYRKNATGFALKVETSYNDRWLSLETEHPDYIEKVLDGHPLFRCEDLESTNIGIKKIPTDTPDGTYLSLASGIDGTAPSTVSDWETVQEKFLNRRLVAFMNTGTTSKDVHKNFREWMKTFPKFPEYIGAIEDFQDDWISLKEYGQEMLISQGWSMWKLIYGWRYVSDPLSVTSRKIPVIGKYIGLRIYSAFNGSLHRSPADRTLGYTFTNDVSGGIVYEDKLEVWDDNVRTELYEAGVNLIQFVQGQGLILRNDRFPTNDFRTRDGHIHWINKVIEFVSEDNLKVLENTPLKRVQTLQRAKTFIEDNLLKPLHNGNLYPYVVSDTPGVAGSGAFVDTKLDGTAAEWNDVSKVRADLTNNPQSVFETGKAMVEVMYSTYSLLNRMRILVYPVSLSYLS